MASGRSVRFTGQVSSRFAFRATTLYCRPEEEHPMTIRVAGVAVLAAVSVAFSAPTFAQASKAKGNPIKIAYIDPLSGPFANVGEAGLHHFRAMADEINSKGGMNGRPIEIVGFDNKVSPAESLNQLKRVI